MGSGSLFEMIKERIKDFPTQSGVYLMKNSADKIIYVGKAKNLKNRVKSYFVGLNDQASKTKALVASIHDIDYLLTKTEVEAFLLEASLIKKHRPKFNIRLKDDKAYPYIQLTWGQDFPRLYLSRKVKRDGSLYFGPYTSGGAVFGTIRFLNRLFKIRDCTDHVFKSRTRPCMTYQIGRCSAPCVKYIDRENYRAEIEGAKDFLKGQSQKLIKDLKNKMKLAAGEEKFEVAARLRDSMFAIEGVIQKQTVVNDGSDIDQDVIAYFGDHRGVLIETLHIRAGRVIGNRPHFLSGLNPLSAEEDPRDWLASFLNQYYDDNFIPDEVILGTDLGHDIHRLLQDVLEERSKHPVKVRYAAAVSHSRSEKAANLFGKDLLEMTMTNAQAHFEKQVSKDEAKVRGLDEIQKKFNLPARPHRIECFDISHFQGSETVASQVVFENGAPAKDHYRRYRIQSVSGIDDFASMYEVLKRRFSHEEYEEPQLLVVDGGKGQLSQAVKILDELNKTHIPVVGLAKARTESNFQASEVGASDERFFLPGRANPITFPTNSEAYQILVGLRDEAHRFAITFHRERREKLSIESELDLIVGLGEKRKRQLLEKFGTIEAIRLADVETIAAMKSFNRVLAERILLHLSVSS